MKLVTKNLTLTQRALLTLISTMVEQAAEFLTGFLITPIIIRGLGLELYGIWGMIQQLLGYFSLTELRATASLRFLLSRQQHRETETEEKQRLIGSTLLLWVLSLPITIIVGVGLVWFLPNIIPNLTPTIMSGAQVALIVLLVNSVLDRLLAIPMHILKAQNMDYVGMGVNTATVLVGSILSGLAVWLGWGLPGLAVATILNVLLISIGRFWVARRAIQWMTIKKPARDEFIRFTKTSGWLFIGGLASLFLTSSDVLLVGMILGPATSSPYVTSGAVLRMIGEPIYQIVGSGNAGLIGLCGKQDWERVAVARKEMYFILLFFMTVLGTGVIALNGSFLRLWLGAEFFGGTALTLFLVLSVIFTFLTRIDYTITDAMLFLQEKTWALFFAGITAVVFGIISLRMIGMTGMALGMAIGNLILLIIAWALIQRRMPEASASLGKSLVRPAITMSITFALAYAIQPFLRIENWLTFLMYGTGIALVALISGWFLVLSQPIRQTLFKRARQNIPFLDNIFHNDDLR
jgi:O-antigen/teichoic acid export membrane protein